MAYRTNTNSVNPHRYRQVSNDAEEMRMLGSNAPSWVDAGARLRYRPLSTAPSKPGWPDISSSAPRPLSNGFNTFHSARAVTIPEREVLYRVVDPASVDNSICWMRKSEFEKLKNKDDWRRHFAVKANWNANGEFVTYTVPRGGLQV